MLGRRRNQRQVPRNSVEDVCSQPRNDTRDFAHNRTQSSPQDNGLNSNRSAPASNYRAPRIMLKSFNSGNASSSGSEEDTVYPRARFGFSRNSTGYETGESSDMTTRRSYVGRRRRNQGFNFTSQELDDSESSSDDTILCPKKVKRPLSPTSSSDTDSSEPIAPKRSKKQMRAISSSESSSSESEHDGNYETVDNNVTITEGGDSHQGSRNSEENLAREIPRSSRESDSEIDVVSIDHTVRGRRIEVILSDNESSLPTRISVPSTFRDPSWIENIHGRINRRIAAIHQLQELHEAEANNHVIRRWQRPDAERNVTIPETDRHNVWRVTSQAEELLRGNTLQPRIRGRIVVGRRTPVIVESEDESETNSSNSEMSNSQGENENVINLRGSQGLSGRLNHNGTSSDDSSSSSSSSSDSDINALPTRSLPVPRNENNTDSHPLSVVASIYLNGDPNLGPLSVERFEVNIKASTAKKVLANRNKTQMANSSSDSDTDTEKCPICLACFKHQQVGKPVSCDHFFCSMCIKKWAKKNNSCPIDRKVFDKLIVYNRFEGKVLCEVPIENPEPEEEEEDEWFEDLNNAILNNFFANEGDEPVWQIDSDNDGPEEICSVCNSGQRPHHMISCDSCELVFHLGCVEPPLRSVPTVNWYCSQCELEGLGSSDYSE